ncbi:hypothetical protein BH11PSE12_BH11PSE12_30190 [soil metagenome]
MAKLHRWALFRPSQRTGWPLWLEIMLILMMKVGLLFLLWNAFFSRPETRHMALPVPKVEQHLLSSTAALPVIVAKQRLYPVPQASQQFKPEAPHGSH